MFSAAPPPALLLSHCSQYSGTAGMGQHRFSVGGRMVTTGGGGALCGDGDQRGKTPFLPSIAPKCRFRGERNPPPPPSPSPAVLGGFGGRLSHVGLSSTWGRGVRGKAKGPSGGGGGLLPGDVLIAVAVGALRPPGVGGAAGGRQRCVGDGGLVGGAVVPWGRGRTWRRRRQPGCVWGGRERGGGGWGGRRPSGSAHPLCAPRW